VRWLAFLGNTFCIPARLVYLEIHRSHYGPKNLINFARSRNQGLCQPWISDYLIRVATVVLGGRSACYRRILYKLFLDQSYKDATAKIGLRHGRIGHAWFDEEDVGDSYDIVLEFPPDCAESPLAREKAL
jgi:hypothetical protein